MKKSMKKVVAVLLMLAMVFSMAGCKKEDDTSSSDSSVTKAPAETSEAGETAEPADDRAAIGAAMDDVTLNIRIMNEFTNMDKVVAKYEELTKDDPILSKIHLNFSFVTGADYKDKLAMAMNAQEDYDLMFVGSWQGLNDYIAQGLFADITSYFNNDAFPGLKAAFSEDYINAAKSFVKNDAGEYEQKLYQIPLAEYYEDIRGVAYREDLRQKYNCAAITDDASLRTFLDTVLANEPDMVGWSMWNGFFFAESARYSGALDNVFWNDSTQVMGEETPFYVGVSEDGKTALNAVVMGDSADQFAKMPEGYTTDFIKAYELDRVKWAPVLDPNRGVEGAVAKDAAAQYCTLTEFANLVKTTADKYPDAKLGFYPTEESQRNMEAGAIVSTMKTNNELVIPEWSEKIDATMYFLDWMFGSKANHDLFAYGIEGDDWEAVGEDGIKYMNLDSATHYTMPQYSFTLNPIYVRVNEIYRQDEKLSALYDYMLNPNSYTKSILSGFTFDASNVSTEIANLSALSSELMTRFAVYGDDTEAKIDEWHKDAEAAGLDTVRAELIKQISEFLDMKNSIQ